MWQEKNNTLIRKTEWKDFSEAFAFMTRVAMAAEKMNHHPTWTNTYNKVEFQLSTHDAGDRSQKKIGSLQMPLTASFNPWRKLPDV